MNPRPKNRPERLKGKPKLSVIDKVLIRDNNTCQKCDEKRHHKLDYPHHIIYKSRGGADTIGNQITLCRPCHRWVHKWNIEILFGDKGWVFIKPETKIL